MDQSGVNWSMQVYTAEGFYIILRRSHNWNSFQCPARGIDLWRTSAVCRWSGGEICLNSVDSLLAALSGSASTAAELEPLDSRSLLLSLPFLKGTPTAASQLLHSVKLLPDCWAQPGFQLQSGGPCLVFAAEGLTDVGAHIHEAS